FISWATRPTTVQSTTYYYYDGKYYTPAVQEGETVYVIVSAPEGMEVDTLPPDAEEQEVQGQSYWYAENTFYQQIQRDGKAVYVVVDAPAGAVIPGLPEDAMEVEDEGDPVYQYDDTYYAAATSEESPTGGYVVQPPPPEETIEAIPADAVYFEVDDVFYYYVDYGLYVLLEGGGYGASEPPLGGVATQLPDGATVITEGDESYFQFDTVFFEMTSRDDSTVYVVIPAPDGSEIVE
ncbi:MAG: DUF6515 family protein, partial [Gemmatimonadota bacterium]